MKIIKEVLNKPNIFENPENLTFLLDLVQGDLVSNREKVEAHSNFTRTNSSIKKICNLRENTSFGFWAKTTIK